MTHNAIAPETTFTFSPEKVLDHFCAHTAEFMRAVDRKPYEKPAPASYLDALLEQIGQDRRIAYRLGIDPDREYWRRQAQACGEEYYWYGNEACRVDGAR